jgi:oligo-1,6-glucosidase
MGDSGWISIFLDNHDFPRLVSRFGNDKKYRVESAKMLAVLIMTMRGTPCIYQGTEIGMSNVHFPSVEQYRDVETHNYHKEFIERGLSEDEFLKRVHEHGRDNARTPMQWDNSMHAGFTTGKPWIDVNPNFENINADSVIHDKYSVYHFYKTVLALRKKEITLVYGEWMEIPQESKDLYVYERKHKEVSMYIILNHSDNKNSYQLDIQGYELLLSNYHNQIQDILLPWEARIYKKL